MLLEKKTGICSLVLISIVFCYTAAAAPLNGDPLAEYSGFAPFSFSSGGNVLTGIIEYAVYDTSKYLGTAPSGGDYLYAYQIQNSSGSTVPASHFTIGIADGTAVYDIYSDSVTLGVHPSYEYFSPSLAEVTSANYDFISHLDDILAPGENSYILLFSSDDTWNPEGFGTIAGGGVGGMVTLPSPIPEPATITLLLAGVRFLRFSRKRKIRFE